ncbi:hypothetical protein PVAP13_7KG230510 [Panicum virgatum]|uniref:Uncharacterized protein n=1 Tax=Panicum virgatum TaxID=38727 RepID=A0A8T0QDK4_PANVG|nr:hypothetical protein PVAP13_7KG230510 [Panicum virgatum]
MLRHRSAASQVVRLKKYLVCLWNVPLPSFLHGLSRFFHPPCLTPGRGGPSYPAPIRPPSSLLVAAAASPPPRRRSALPPPCSPPLRSLADLGGGARALRPGPQRISAPAFKLSGSLASSSVDLIGSGRALRPGARRTLAVQLGTAWQRPRLPPPSSAPPLQEPPRRPCRKLVPALLRPRPPPPLLSSASRRRTASVRPLFSTAWRQRAASVHPLLYIFESLYSYVSLGSALHIRLPRNLQERRRQHDPHPLSGFDNRLSSIANDHLFPSPDVPSCSGSGSASGPLSARSPPPPPSTLRTGSSSSGTPPRRRSSSWPLEDDVLQYLVAVEAGGVCVGIAM